MIQQQIILQKQKEIEANIRNILHGKPNSASNAAMSRPASSTMAAGTIQQIVVPEQRQSIISIVSSSRSNKLSTCTASAAVGSQLAQLSSVEGLANDSVGIDSGSVRGDIRVRIENDYFRPNRAATDAVGDAKNSYRQ